MNNGVKWGQVLTGLRRARQFLRDGDATTVDLILTEQIEHIGTTLNAQMKDKFERRQKKARERLLARINRKTD